MGKLFHLQVASNELKTEGGGSDRENPSGKYK